MPVEQAETASIQIAATLPRTRLETVPTDSVGEFREHARLSVVVEPVVDRCEPVEPVEAHPAFPEPLRARQRRAPVVVEPVVTVAESPVPEEAVSCICAMQ